MVDKLAQSVHSFAFTHLHVGLHTVSLELVNPDGFSLPSRSIGDTFAEVEFVVGSTQDADSLGQAGVDNFSHQEFQRARFLFSAMATLRPYDANALYNLGVACDRLKKYKVASSAYEQAIAVSDGQHVGAFSLLASVLRKSGKAERAHRVYQVVARLAGGGHAIDYGTHAHWGVVLSLLGRHALSVYHFEAALRLNPYDTGVHETYARVLLEMSNSGAAREVLLLANKPIVACPPPVTFDQKPKGVIIYKLGPSQNYYDDLKLSMALLDQNFIAKFQYPVIVFHESNDPEQVQAWQLELKRIAPRTSFRMEYLDMSVGSPAHVGRGELAFSKITQQFGASYRHMCRFFSGKLFQHPTMQEFDFYWRLDTDSFLVDEVPYDVFARMHQERLSYGYAEILEEDATVVVGLWETVQKYVQSVNIDLSVTRLHRMFFKDGAWDRSQFYTNFELGRLSFFRSAEYSRFFADVDAAGGFYRDRWGDGPVRFLGVNLLLNDNQIALFNDVPYMHQSLVRLGASSELPCVP